jgi:hypothetical protein
MKETLKTILRIIVIYAILFGVNGLFSTGGIFLDTDLSTNKNISISKVYRGQELSNRALVSELTREELNLIIPNITSDSGFYRTGRQIVWISKYTTGNNLLDFVPFLSFNDEYKIIATEDFDENIGMEDCSKYFNLWHMGDYALGWMLALAITILSIFPAMLAEHYKKKNNVIRYKIASITAKITGLMILTVCYFSDNLYVSVRVFLNNSFLHLIVSVILARLIAQVININKPIEKLKEN